MNLPLIITGVIIVFVFAYRFYGRFLSRRMGLSETLKTPAHELKDGVDFVPTKRSFLLGQHFSAIAAAGPIVGPILAGLWFGWLPVLIWIVGGAVFFGAVHDFSSLVGSVRHKASSIVDIVRQHVGTRGYILFLIFVWFSLVYVITAFTDLTSSSFVDPELGSGVASSSLMYLGVGLLMGIALQKLGWSLRTATAVFVPMVFGCVVLGHFVPISVPAIGLFAPQKVWNVVLLFYCFAASIAPVWLLLQPRGFLGGYFLYVTLALGLVGLFLEGGNAQYPAFLGFVSDRGFPLFPILFVTVACGACSGFHGIVCSGTTSKQIDKETDCRAVGYGGMLLEGLVAVLALATVMVLAKTDPLTQASPDRVYAEGLGRFVEHLGIPRFWARSFVLLAFTTFIYDTLDVTTRLARQILQELFGWEGMGGRMMATFLSLIVPFFSVSLKMTDPNGHAIPAWKVFWTLFGTSNQLLAGLTLMAITYWLWRTRRSWWMSAVPMVFMIFMTFWSLLILVKPLFVLHRSDPVSLVSLFLLVVAVLLIAETCVRWLELRRLGSGKQEMPS